MGEGTECLKQDKLFSRDSGGRRARTLDILKRRDDGLTCSEGSMLC